MKKLIFIKLIYVLTLAIFYLSSTHLNMMYAQTNTICDNGSFEQDFLYYTGDTARYRKGSDNCIPLDFYNNGAVFSSVSLPYTDRFEIVTSGSDLIANINRTKFGNKALRINSWRGTEGPICDGNYGVDKITKEFVVTEETRNFTVWYALALENPLNSHYNSQPWFSITCDLDPAHDLCFDASILNCQQAPGSNSCNYDTLDVLDWTCHRFIIPKSEIGKIATLEITVGDCGLGRHFGYAYIDGICEECAGSVLGSIVIDTINYYSCEADTTHICGSFTLPYVCNETWSLKELNIPGYTVNNLVIDTPAQTFCFDFPISNFGTEDCVNVIATTIFTNGVYDLPSISSNEIEVCKSKYKTYTHDVVISNCFDNTPTGGTADNNISDDYYYVYVNLDNTNNSEWTIDRELYDPYPNEITTREIASGIGDEYLTLGPFRIQEGSWKLSIIFDDCTYDEDIDPPSYCSGCPNFYALDISSISCNSSNNNWSFNINVPGDVTKQYSLYLGANKIGDYFYGSTYPIPPRPISPTCLTYELIDVISNCNSFFTICPPKPCVTACNLEVYEKNMTCTKLGSSITFLVELEVSGPTGKYLCYAVNGTPVGILPNPQILGPYNQDVEITISLCDDANCSVNCTSCYKTIYVPLPDCNQPSPLILSNDDNEALSVHELRAYPNPMHSDELILESKLVSTEFEIWDAFGRRIVKDSFRGQNYRFNLNESSGLYLIRYKNSNGNFTIIKVIKL